MTAGPGTATGWRPAVEAPAPPAPAAPRRRAQRIVVPALVGLLAVVVAGRWATGLRGRPVLVITRPVAAGAVLTRDDLATTRVAGAVDAIGADRAGEVAGRAAVVDLLSGTLLTTAMLTGRPAPAAGEAIVAVAVDPAAVPAELRAGAKVRVVAVPAGEDPGRVLSPLARVLSVRTGESGELSLSLLLPDREADLVARAAAARSVSLVVLAPGEPAR